MLSLLLTLILPTDFNVTPGFTIKPATFTVKAAPKAEPWQAYLEGARPYRRTVYSQRVVVLNDRETIQAYHHDADDVSINDFKPNPNSRRPYAVPGGMEHLDYRSNLYVSIPEGKKIRVWKERVNIFQGGLLPKLRWSFPDGTRFVDVLSTDKGEFEVRVREKTRGEWFSSIVHRDKGKQPPGYKGAGKACSECHQKAGASEQYGITVRGDDGCFSFPVLKEGTLDADSGWPVEVSRAEPQPRVISPIYLAQPAAPVRRVVAPSNCST